MQNNGSYSPEAASTKPQIPTMTCSHSEMEVNNHTQAQYKDIRTPAPGMVARRVPSFNPIWTINNNTVMIMLTIMMMILMLMMMMMMMMMMMITVIT